MLSGTGLALVVPLVLTIILLAALSVVVFICISKKKKNNSITIDFTENNEVTNQSLTGENCQPLQSKTLPSEGFQRKNNLDLEAAETHDKLHTEPGNGLKAGPRLEATRSPVNKKWYDSSALDFMDASTDTLDKI